MERKVAEQTLKAKPQHQQENPVFYLGILDQKRKLSASHTISFLVDGVLFCSHPGLPPAFQHHPFRMSFLTVK
ncbi:hypothetical protein H8959_012723 [Pygathrix nigripes]